MFNRYLGVAVLGGLIALPACTSNQSAVEPPITVANLSQDQLQFQVGTANIAGTAALNTVTTFRQPNGLSAVLVSTPAITLPFTNTAPVTVAGIDSGTNQISSTPQQPAGAVIATSQVTTFGQPVGVFSYGFLASNSVQTGANNSSFYATNLAPASGTGGTGHASGQNTMPYYAPNASRNAFYVGPPFLPNFKDGSLGTTFLGAPSGFTTFALTPTTGTYALNVVLPGSSQAAPTFTSTTTLTSTALLPAMPTPAFATDNTGGGTVTLTVPVGIRETMIELRNVTLGTFYTAVVQGAGPKTVTIADNLGTITGGVAGPTFRPGPIPNGATAPIPGTGDSITVIAVGFDYPAMEAVEFGNATFPEAPVINNAGAACTFATFTSTCPGQADLTQSATLSTKE